MNQPMGLCTAATWYEECAHSFSHVQQPPAASNLPRLSINQLCSPSTDGNAPLHEDWDLGLSLPSPEAPGAALGGSDSAMDTSEDSEVVPPGRFVETYEGCSEAFSGGRTFMDAFCDDQYADERQSNLYFPFASRKEWQLASWLLRSRLSLGAIDSLLALDIVRQLIFRFPLSQLNVIQLQEVPLSFRTGNQLRT